MLILALPPGRRVRRSGRERAPLQQGKTMSVLLGVCNWAHPLLQSPSCCAKLKDVGIQALQLDLGASEDGFPLTSAELRRRWREEADRHGLRLDAVAVLDVMKHGMVAEPGSERRKTVEEAVAAAVDCAAGMGIPQILLPSFGASAIRTRDDLRETARCLRWACALAKRRGIAVATENLLDAGMTKTLFAVVSYDNLRTFLDLSNFTLRRREKVLDELPEYLAACGGVHIKDGMYGKPGVRLLGDGVAQVEKQLAALQRTGYTGALFLENAYAAQGFEEPFAALGNDVAYLRRAVL